MGIGGSAFQQAGALNPHPRRQKFGLIGSLLDVA